MTRTAVLIVEKDFLSHHVGVRNVIFHYWRRLEQQGHAVSLAALSKGKLILGQAPALKVLEREAADPRADAPTWTSKSGGEFRLSELPSVRRTPSIVWTAKEVSAQQFDISIVTNPWLCAEGLPDGPFSAGIVYDMVPNLLACGGLNLDSVIDIYQFAHAHDVGYRAYLKNARHILCISESARIDFRNFYRLADDAVDRLGVMMPFAPLAATRVRPARRATGETRRILLVNILDPRKNYNGALTALQIASQDHRFDVDIVGRERMSLSRVRDFLTDMSRLGGKVNWYRYASSACLNRLYAATDVLLFPSLYEGLGLPILEAQAHGQPVVSSNVSSCGEINLNPDLAVDPRDHDALADRVCRVLTEEAGILRGRPMATTLSAFVYERNLLPSDWTREKP